MYHATITPHEAVQPRIVSLEEQLHEAVNALLYSRYRGEAAVIYQEDVHELIGPKRWNVAEHPQTLVEIMERYALSGWHVIDSTENPHRRCWTFKSQLAS